MSHNTCIPNSQWQLLIGQVGPDVCPTILSSSLLNYCYWYNKWWHMTSSSAFNMDSHCVSAVLICFYHRVKGIPNFMLSFIFKSVVLSNDAFHHHYLHHAALLSYWYWTHPYFCRKYLFHYENACLPPIFCPIKN